MRLDKLAVTAQEAFQSAMGVAGEADAAVIEPIHLLKALLDSDENNLAAIVKRIGADPVWLSQNVADEIAKMPKQTGAAPMAIPGQDLIKVIDNSVKIAEKLGDSYATSEHLLIALSEDKGAAGRILTTAGITRKNIEAAYESLRGDTRVTSQTSSRPWSSSARTSPNRLARASWTRSSAATRRFAAPFRCSRAARRTTRCSSASRAPARPPSWRVWPSASWPAMCPLP